jgi:hypothetical protein
MPTPGPRDPRFQALCRSARHNWEQWVGHLTPRTQHRLRELSQPPATPQAEPRWHLLLLPETGPPELTDYRTIEDLIEAIKPRADERDLRAYAFYGWELSFSRRPHRYLIHPNGTPHPLFDVASPVEIEIQTDHQLGPDPEEEVSSTIAANAEPETPEDRNWDLDEDDEEEPAGANEENEENEEEAAGDDSDEGVEEE